MEVVLSEAQSEKIKDQLNSLIDEVIKNRLEKIKPYKRYLTRNELQKFVGIGNSSMEILKQNGLQYAVLGNKHLFDIEDVYEILNNLKTK